MKIGERTALAHDGSHPPAKVATASTTSAERAPVSDLVLSARRAENRAGTLGLAYPALPPSRVRIRSVETRPNREVDLEPFPLT